MITGVRKCPNWTLRWLFFRESPGTNILMGCAKSIKHVFHSSLYYTGEFARGYKRERENGKWWVHLEVILWYIVKSSTCLPHLTSDMGMCRNKWWIFWYEEHRKCDTTVMIGQGGAAGGPDGVWRHGRPTGASARGRILQGWHEPWQGGRLG